MTYGWQLVGFSDELTGDMTDVLLGGKPILLIRANGRLRAFDGTCPHRGARLAKGGVAVGNAVTCPFHGYKIRLGQDPIQPESALCVTEYPAVEVAELVFVHLGAAHGAPECGFENDIARLKQQYVFVHGFTMALPVSPRLVIENAFDTAHFGPVHHVPQASKLEVARFDARDDKPLTATGSFRIAASEWDPEPTGSPVDIAYEARAYGPGLIISAQTGSSPYVFLVGATAHGTVGCTARVVLMLPKSADGALPDMDKTEWLLGAMESQLAADLDVWLHLPVDAPTRLQPGEEAIAQFWSFCDQFAPAPAAGKPMQ